MAVGSVACSARQRMHHQHMHAAGLTALLARSCMPGAHLPRRHALARPSPPGPHAQGRWAPSCSGEYGDGAAGKRAACYHLARQQECFQATESWRYKSDKHAACTTYPGFEELILQAVQVWLTSMHLHALAGRCRWRPPTAGGAFCPHGYAPGHARGRPTFRREQGAPEQSTHTRG